MRKFLNKDCEKILDTHLHDCSPFKLGKKLRDVYFKCTDGGCVEHENVQLQLEAMCFAVNQLGAYLQKHPIKLKKEMMLQVIFSMNRDVADTVCNDLTGWMDDIVSVIPED